MPIPSLIMGGLGLAGGLATNAWNAREASRNRAWQERMSSTAHQREVQDLIRAGINPMMRNLGGASTPAGDRADMEDPVGKGIHNALAVQRQRAEIKLLEKQALKTEAEDEYTRYQKGWMEAQMNAGYFDKFVSDVELGKLSVEKVRRELPFIIPRAMAEIEQLGSNARAARARAMLDEAARTGALNIEEFERMVGSSGQWVKFLVNMFRSLRR